MLTVFTGQDTSLPIHTTVVVTQGDGVLNFTLVTLDSTMDWVVDLLKIDKGNGDIRLYDGWEELFWKNNRQLTTKNKGKKVFAK